MRVLVAYV